MRGMQINDNDISSLANFKRTYLIQQTQTSRRVTGGHAQYKFHGHGSRIVAAQFL
jgi:hypothetical protein